jgi:pilus assembly protein CpaE
MSDGIPGRLPASDRRVSVALVDSDPTIRAVLVDHLKKLDVIAVAYEGLDRLLDAANSTVPTIAVVGPSEPPDTLVPQIETFLHKRRTCAAVMLVFDLAPEVVQQAFRAGIDDVVAVRADDSELLSAIRRASERLEKRLAEEEQAALLATVVPTTPAEETPVAGRVVTVFGTKGGIGKSVVATNLAAALAREVDGLVALVDGNLQFGDAALLLELQPSHTITEAAVAGDRLDADLLEDLLLKHEPTGVMVLAAPTEPGAADQIQRADFHRILVVLREMCSYVVVDTSPHLSDITLVALEQADDIVLVANLDIMSLKNSRVSLQALQVLGIPFSKIKFVLNRVTSSGPLFQADAEKVLQMKADAVLPGEEVVWESVNRGLPAVLSAPTSRFASSMQGLVGALAGRTKQAKHRTKVEPSTNGHGPLPEPAPVPTTELVPTVGDEEGEPKRRYWVKRRAKETETASI